MKTEEHNFIGKITISKLRGLNEKECICIQLEDENYIRFFQGRMTLENFGEVITGQGGIPIKCELRGLDKVNKRRETKEIEIQMPDEFIKTYNSKERTEIAKKAVSPHEIDGWSADLSQINNQHYFSHSQTDLKIKFYRYVDKS